LESLITILTIGPDAHVTPGRRWVMVLTANRPGRPPKNDETPRSCQGAAGFLITDWQSSKARRQKALDQY
jgi:hypothetical protein